MLTFQKLLHKDGTLLFWGWLPWIPQYLPSQTLFKYSPFVNLICLTHLKVDITVKDLTTSHSNSGNPSALTQRKWTPISHFGCPPPCGHLFFTLAWDSPGQRIKTRNTFRWIGEQHSWFSEFKWGVLDDPAAWCCHQKATLSPTNPWVSHLGNKGTISNKTTKCQLPNHHPHYGSFNTDHNVNPIAFRGLKRTFWGIKR